MLWKRNSSLLGGLVLLLYVDWALAMCTIGVDCSADCLRCEDPRGPTPCQCTLCSAGFQPDGNVCGVTPVNCNTINCPSPHKCSNDRCACATGFLSSSTACNVTAQHSQVWGPTGQARADWAIVGNTIHVQLTHVTAGWGGLMFGGNDSSNAMTGDTWQYTVTTTGVVTMKDGFSNARVAPPFDTAQSLVNIAGRRAGNSFVVNFDRLLDTGDVNDTKIEAGVTYKVVWALHTTNPALTAIHNSRETDFSQTIQWFPLVNVPPGIPPNFRLALTSSTSLTLAWDAAFQGSAAITQYLVEVNSGRGFLSTPATAGLTTTLLGLTAATSFQLRLSARNADNLVSGFASLTASTLAANQGPPAAGTSPTVGAITETTVALSWTEPNLFGLALVEYIVEIQPANGVSQIAFLGNVTATTLSGLTDNTTYTINYRARTIAGTGELSAPATARTLPFPGCQNACSGHGVCVGGSCHCNPGFLRLDCSEAAPLSIEFGTSSHRLHWSYDATFLYVQMEYVTTNWAGFIWGSTGGMDIGGDAWMVKVNSDGSVEASDRFAANLVQPKLDGTNNLVDVHGYESGGTTFVNFKRSLVTGDSNDVPITVLKVDNAAWAVGQSDTFSQVHCSTADICRSRVPGGISWLTPFGPPSAPRDLVLTAATESSLTVAWNFPEFDGSSATSSYIVSFRSGGGAFQALAPQAATQARTRQITGLPIATAVTVQVVAVNLQGSGPPIQNVFTTLSPNAVPPDAPPNAPTILNFTQVTITVAWDGIVNLRSQSLLDYIWEVDDGTGFFELERSTSTTITGSFFDPEKTYTFRVRAVTAAGIGNPSPTVSVTTLAFPPCPGNCGSPAGGNCIRGVCQCNEGFLKSDCSLPATLNIPFGPGHVVYWAYDNTNLYVQMVYVSFNWCGLIWGGPGGMIPGGDAWMVRTKTDGSFDITDRSSNGFKQPPLDLTNNLVDQVAYETNTKTIASFTRALVTGDSSDVALTAPVPMEIAWAVGLDDDFTRAHSNINGVSRQRVGPIVWLQPVGSPSAPRNLILTAADETTLTLSWVAPEFQGGSNIIEYLVERDDPPTGGGFTLVASVGPATLSAPVGELTTGTTYNWRVSARNSQGQGSPATAAFATLGSVNVPPATPVGPPIASPVAQTTMTLIWDQPNLNGNALLRYHLELAIGAGAFVEVYTGVPATTTLTGLTASTEYRVRFSAETSVGVSPFSPILTVFTLPDCPNSCSSNGDCVGGSCHCNPGFLKLDCSLPAPLTKTLGGVHRVNWGYDSTDLFVQMDYATLNWAGLIWGGPGGMDPNGDAWMVVVNSNGVQALDRSANGLSVPLTDGQQDLFDVQGYETASRTIVNFRRPLLTGDTTNDISLTAIENMEIAWAIGQSDNVNQAHAVSGRGRESPIIWLLPFGPSSAPRNVRLDAASNDTITVVWDAPAFDGSSPVTSFVIQRDNNDGIFVFLGTSTALTFVITGLTPSTSYQVRVAAVNAAGQSAFATVNLATLAGAAQAPSSPGPITLVQALETSIQLAWSEPNLFGLALIRYILEISPGATGNFTIAYQGLPPTTTITGLTANSPFTFRVSAQTAGGVSANSPTLLVTTLAFGGCSNNCGGATNGVCFQGTCHCNIGFVRLDCSEAAPLRINKATTGTFGGGHRFFWSYDATNLYGQFAYATTSWVGLIWGGPGGMDAGGDAWMGRVTATGVELFDRRAAGFTVPITDTNNLVDVTGYELNGNTVINFRRALRTEDANDVALTANVLHNIAWAIGVNDNLAQAHGRNSLSRAREAQIRWLEPFGPPTAPRNLVLSGNPAATSFSLQVAWTAPEFQGSGPVTGYIVQRDNAGGGVFVDVTTTAANVLVALISGLTAATSYQVRVAAVNSAGTGLFTTVTLSTLSLANQPPATPVIAIADQIAQTSVRITMTEPNLDGLSLLFYRIEVQAAGGNFVVAYEDTNPVAVLTGLADATQHNIRYLVASAAGLSGFSAVLSVTTLAFLPCSPSPNCNGNGNCVRSECVCNAGFIGGDCSLVARSECVRDVQRVHCIHWAVNGSTLFFDIDFQTTGWAGVIYDPFDGGMLTGDCWIAIVNDQTGVPQIQDRFSPARVTPTLDTTNDLTLLTGRQLNGRTIVSFSRPLNTNDSQDKPIRVDPAPLAWAIGVSDVFVKHLSTDFARFPRNLDLAAAPPPSGPPQNLFPIRATSTVSFTVTWQAPVDTGNLAIIAYNLTLRPATGSNAVVQSFIVSPSPTTFTFSNLSPQTAFLVEVSAVTAAGIGAPQALTASTSPVVQLRPVAPKPPNVTAAPAALNLVWESFAAADLNGQDFVGYQVEISTGGSAFQLVYEGRDAFATLVDLEPLTTYNVQVRLVGASLSDGLSDPSTLVTATTLALGNCPGTPQCGGRGTCSLAGECLCDQGSLGAACEFTDLFALCYESGKVCLEWTIVGTTEMLMRVIARRVDGPGDLSYWIGLIYGTEDDRMRNGDAWVWHVQTGADGAQVVTASDYFAIDLFTPTTDGQNDVKNSVGFFNATHVVIQFSRLLETGDPGDIAIVSGAKSLGYAFGTDNGFSYHRETGKGLAVDLLTGGVQRLELVLVQSAFIPFLVACILIIAGGAVVRHLMPRSVLAQTRVGSPPEKTGLLDRLTLNIRPLILDLTWGQFLAMIVFFGSIILVLVSTKGGFAYAMGNVSVCFLTAVLLPVTRNSIWTVILGVPFERAIKFHRLLARWAIFCVFVHFVVAAKQFTLTYALSATKTSYGLGGLFGFLSFLCFLIMFVFSLETVRRKQFDVFYWTHSLYILAWALAAAHNITYLILSILPVALYIVDRVALRNCKRATVKKIELLNSTNGRVTKLTITTGLRYEPGSYVFINVPSISSLEWHPFSISSYPLKGASEASAMTFHILDMEGTTWTNKLAKLAQRELSRKSTQPFAIAIDGPYGRLSLPILKYPCINLICGGVGVTPMMSIFSYLFAQEQLGNLPHVKRIHLIWSSRVPATALIEHWYPKIFRKLRKPKFSTEKFWISVYETNIRHEVAHERLTVGLNPQGDIELSTDTSVHPKVTVTQGRPGLDELLTNDVAATSVLGSGVCVLACGPESLVSSAQRVATAHKAHFHKETFFL